MTCCQGLLWTWVAITGLLGLVLIIVGAAEQKVATVLVGIASLLGTAILLVKL